jgi:type IV pilus assembly protein PilC
MPLIEIQEGAPLSVPLSRSKYFPPVLSQMMAVGEETGDIETVLIKLANFYDREVDEVTESLTSILEPIMIVVLGSIIGVIALSVYGPITQLTKTI